MSTVTTELNAASLDGVTASVIERRLAPARARGHAHQRLRRLGGMLGAAAVIPMLFMALGALVLTLLAKLLIELVVAGFER